MRRICSLLEAWLSHRDTGEKAKPWTDTKRLEDGRRQRYLGLGLGFWRMLGFLFILKDNESMNAEAAWSLAAS